jgi:hypothetical protein
MFRGTLLAPFSILIFGVNGTILRIHKINWNAVLGVVFALAFVFASNAYAGKVELTTYYPAPYGEYRDVKAAHSFQVPVKPVHGDVGAVTTGEIWVEGPCPGAGTWNGTACV